MSLPPGLCTRRVVCVLTEENFQVPGTVQVAPDRELRMRVVVDTGLGASLIRAELLPPTATLMPREAETAYMRDINGNILPIVGLATLSSRMGTREADVAYGVVPNMSVPVFVRTPYVTTQVPIICGTEYWIKLINGCVVPILRKGKRVAPLPTRESNPVCACRTWASAALHLACRTVIPAKSVGFVAGCTDFLGNGMVHPSPAFDQKHQVHVALGPMLCQTGTTWKARVLNLSTQAKTLKAGTKLGFVDPVRESPSRWRKKCGRGLV